MRNIEEDSTLVACCGLYCGACTRYLKEKCDGCNKESGPSWCKVRKCCQENNHATCAECVTYPDVSMCSVFNNMMARIVSFIMNSDRALCICQIREIGMKRFTEKMTFRKEHSLKKK